LKKVFVSHELPGSQIHQLARRCDMHVWTQSGLLPPAVLAEQLSGSQGLLCLLTDQINRPLIDSLPELQFVSSMSVGVDHVDVAALTERGIPLGHTPGVLVDTTADAAFALLLCAARRIAEADQYVKAGKWRRENGWSPDFFTGKDVSGATLGIIGLGAIGQAVAKRAAGFGMRVLGFNRSPRDVTGVENVSLEQLLLRSDFVSLHVALTPETANLMDADRIANMKPGAVLVNTGRGGIVDEHALAEALRNGRLYAAGIDVFAKEPVETDNPLLSLPNVVVAPHIGSATVLTRAKMADLAVENIMAALSGQPMPHCVNPEVYR
jgi:glyoxylate reductase